LVRYGCQDESPVNDEIEIHG
jgi:hypothetical protein